MSVLRRSVVAAGFLVVAVGGGGRGGFASSRTSEPPPPVSSSAFAFEPAGSAPVPNDGRIPNPATPDGAHVGPPAHCDVTYSSAAGATAKAVNAEIARVENSITHTFVVCLEGTFTRPIHVDDKWSPALLEVASAPGRTARLELGAVRPSEVDRNDHDGGDTGGVTVADSRGVVVEGLSISGYHSDGPAYAPAGIYVTVRQSGSRSVSVVPHQSPCFWHGDDTCGDIYLLDNHISDIVNQADEIHSSRSDCNNQDVGAFGIAVLSFGNDPAHALQHVVVEGNTLQDLRTGQSESLTVNGDVEDFTVARNTVARTDNIGIDAIGWEEGTDQARHGYIGQNSVSEVDTLTNASYGRWTGSVCLPLPENAAGVYDDGGSYIWIDRNTVTDTNQGIDLDVETPSRATDHLLVTRNVVTDGPGTGLRSGRSGHAFDAFYVDAFGRGSSISAVYVHDNVFRNESQYYGATSAQEAPVVDFGGSWSHVLLWDNTVEGGSGRHDRLNPLLQIDNLPVTAATIDCTRYLQLTADPLSGNFVLPSRQWPTLSGWRAGNGHGWDAHSTTAAGSGPPPGCPSAAP